MVRYGEARIGKEIQGKVGLGKVRSGTVWYGTVRKKQSFCHSYQTTLPSLSDNKP